MINDVIVIGLGGMGSAAAFHLAKRGQRVLGLEQYGRAHDKGSSHGASRIIRQAYYEHPAYVPLILRAYELWRELGDDLLCITGGLMLGREQSPVVQGTLASAQEHNLQHEVLNANELRQRFPVLNPRPDDIGVYETLAGFLRPELCVEAHLAGAERYSADLHFEESVLSWTAHPSGNGVSVTTNCATYEAERLVIAPGAWAPSLLCQLGLKFEIRRHVMCWFDPSSNAESFLPDRFPIYLWDVDSHSIFYGFPATDGEGSGVKAAMHTGGEKCTAATIDREITTQDVEELRAPISRLIPALNGPLLKAATCMYTLTPDEHFVLALHPEHPQVSIAAGFSGHGFKFTSVIGEILADLVIDGRTRHPITLFDPTRKVFQECGATSGESASA